MFKDQPLNSRKKSKNKRKNKKNNNIEDKADLSSNTIEPSLTFLKSESNQNNQIVQNLQTNFELRTGRQTNTDKVVVPGFPNGLPSQVPEGVKIALASAQRGKKSFYVHTSYCHLHRSKKNFLRKRLYWLWAFLTDICLIIYKMNWQHCRSKSTFLHYLSIDVIILLKTEQCLFYSLKMMMLMKRSLFTR